MRRKENPKMWDLYYNIVSKLNNLIQGQSKNSFAYYISPVHTLDKITIYDTKFRKVASFDIDVICGNITFGEKKIPYDDIWDLYRGVCAMVDRIEGTCMMQKEKEK